MAREIDRFARGVRSKQSAHDWRCMVLLAYLAQRDRPATLLDMGAVFGYDHTRLNVMLRELRDQCRAVVSQPGAMRGRPALVWSLATPP